MAPASAFANMPDASIWPDRKLMNILRSVGGPRNALGRRLSQSPTAPAIAAPAIRSSSDGRATQGPRDVNAVVNSPSPSHLPGLSARGPGRRLRRRASRRRNCSVGPSAPPPCSKGRRDYERSVARHGLPPPLCPGGPMPPPSPFAISQFPCDQGRRPRRGQWGEPSP